MTASLASMAGYIENEIPSNGGPIKNVPGFDVIPTPQGDKIEGLR
jgi:hypothetical protein